MKTNKNKEPNPYKKYDDLFDSQDNIYEKSDEDQYNDQDGPEEKDPRFDDFFVQNNRTPRNHRPRNQFVIIRVIIILVIFGVFNRLVFTSDFTYSRVFIPFIVMGLVFYFISRYIKNK